MSSHLAPLTLLRALPFLVVVTGCTAIAPIERATVLEVGTLELSGSAHVATEPVAFGPTFPLPGLTVAGRAGVASGVDLGISTSSSSGFGVSAKFRLHESEHFALSLMPAVTTWLPLNLTSTVTGTALVGWKLSGGHELVLAPRVGFYGYDNPEVADTYRLRAEPFALAGGMVGALFRVGPRVTLAASAGSHYVLPALGYLGLQDANRLRYGPQFQANAGVIVTLGSTEEGR